MHACSKIFIFFEVLNWKKICNSSTEHLFFYWEDYKLYYHIYFSVRAESNNVWCKVNKFFMWKQYMCVFNVLMIRWKIKQKLSWCTKCSNVTSQTCRKLITTCIGNCSPLMWSIIFINCALFVNKYLSLI